MKIFEVVQLREESKVGREYQHLEDLVFVDGSQGAIRAANILKRLGTDASDVSIKWDGRIAVYWGRDEQGNFVFVNKNAWGKTKVTSSQDMRNLIQQAGKGEEWREKLGNDLGEIFDILKASTPSNFRGYVFGDLLYFPGDPYQVTKAGIEFTPNHVTYTVNINSKLGKRIAQSKVGIVVHLYFKEFGGTQGSPINDLSNLNSREVVVLGPTYVAHGPKIDTGSVDKIIQIAKQNAALIDNFLAPKPGLSDMKNIIYTYVNYMSKSKQLDNLSSGFETWLKGSKVSTNKQAKILSSPDLKALPIIFNLVSTVMNVKNNIIDQLDKSNTDVVATTHGEPGGEGYVASKDKVKLVPRHRWTPS